MLLRMVRCETRIFFVRTLSSGWSESKREKSPSAYPPDYTSLDLKQPDSGQRLCDSVRVRKPLARIVDSVLLHKHYHHILA